ncbi:glycosyltransferase family 4 protein, partial [Candidatus Microgenomates bacterium]|nr:glycosyltransferase family 4 protein [Candidatus Microgenomates bacterium]
FTILCISRRDPVKGVEILEKAVKQIPGVKLNLVSGRRRTIKDFANADLYVLPSLSEGFPIVLLEAMAAKLPIVATDVGDCKELIQGASCGLIVRPGSSLELANAIKKMIADKNRVKMGERGRVYVEKNHTWEQVAAIYHSAYRGASSRD